MKQQNRYEQVIRAFYSAPWAILPEKLEMIGTLLELRASGGFVAAEEIERISAASKRPGPSTPGTVAVIPIYGVISPRMNLMQEFSGGTSIDQLTSAYRSAFSNPDVKAIIFDIDSPGGQVQGVHELAQEILANRGQKKTVAVSNGLMASAAYYIGCAADEIVASPSSLTGSIGVLCAHEDVSKMEENIGIKTTLVSAGKYKVEGNPYEPLSEDARNSMQAIIDSYYGQFVDTVADARGTDAQSVRAGFGQGRCLPSKAAVSAGLVDKIATLDQTLARFSAIDPRSNPKGSRGKSDSAVTGSLSQEQIEAGIRDGVAASKADAGADCTCPCPECMDDDCDACSDADCACEGCTCDMNMKAAQKKVAEANALALSAHRERMLLLQAY